MNSYGKGDKCVSMTLPRRIDAECIVNFQVIKSEKLISTPLGPAPSFAFIANNFGTQKSFVRKFYLAI